MHCLNVRVVEAISTMNLGFYHLHMVSSIICFLITNLRLLLVRKTFTNRLDCSGWWPNIPFCAITSFPEGEVCTTQWRVVMFTLMILTSLIALLWHTLAEVWDSESCFEVSRKFMFHPSLVRTSATTQDLSLHFICPSSLKMGCQNVHQIAICLQQFLASSRMWVIADACAWHKSRQCHAFLSKSI